jgi:pimeloyl-ACP methyl ester carboxylesterase
MATYTGLPHRWITRHGTRYHYLDAGSGETVVMVHGNPSWSYHYRHLVASLQDRFRCIVPDHLGCGLSGQPSEDDYAYTLDNRVADLEALIDHLDIDGPVSLVMHDWGGMIGSAYAAQHPQRIKRMVFCNTAAFPLPVTRPLHWFLRLARAPLVGDLVIRGGNAFVRGTAWIGCQRRGRMPQAVRDAYAWPYPDWHRRLAVHRFIQDIPLRKGDRAWRTVGGVAEALPTLRKRIPAMLAWGGRDPVFDHHFLAAWRQHWPEIRLRHYPQGGHYILEDARDDLLPRIRAFLAGGPRA